MASWRIWMGLTLLGLSLACGGDDDEQEPTGPKGTKIDCTWFEGDNCWKRALASASACLPESSALGTLSAAGDRCTYSSGHTVTFNKPVNLESNGDDPWDFSISSSAGQCLSYRETTTGFTLVTPAGTFTEGAVGQALQLTCPDGSQFYMESALGVLECNLFDLPGYSTSSSSSSVVFSFIGAEDGSQDVFECREQ